MTSPTRPGDALSETQRRFLSAVLERLPRELVHEVYLFAPMKQGGVETGIAVVAIGEAAAPGADPAGAGDAGAAESGVAGADAGSAGTDAAAEEDSTVGGSPYAGSPDVDDADVDDADVDDADVDDANADDADVDDANGDDVDDVDDVDDPDADNAAAQAEGDADAATGQAEMPAPDGRAGRARDASRPARFTIHTARYRLQLKGPERGRWEVDVVEEADAPLVTVDAVVRGVHRRSGEPSEVERLAPHDLARALGEIPWTSES